MGIQKEDMCSFSRAAVWGRTQARQWGRSWTQRSTGNATVPPLQPGTLLPRGQDEERGSSFWLKIASTPEHKQTHGVLLVVSNIPRGKLRSSSIPSVHASRESIDHHSRELDSQEILVTQPSKDIRALTPLDVNKKGKKAQIQYITG